MKEILKVIVGSQAHGLATPESDFDYRGVFVNPTAEILKLGSTIKQTNWIEGEVDDTSWELGHFLFLATKCNPTILEVFLAPIAEDPNIDDSDRFKITKEGKELRDLFPYIWSSKGVYDAFTGYGFNQRKKFLDDKDRKAAKYAAAYLRTLYQAWELLSTGRFTVKIANTPIGETVLRFKNGQYTVGEVMQTCTDWQERVSAAYFLNSDKQTNMEPVNEFLLKVRKEYWNEYD